MTARSTSQANLANAEAETRPQGEPSTRPVVAGATRLVSLDALRGFNMLWITGLDTVFRALAAASGFSLLTSFSAQLEHEPWGPGFGRLASGFRGYDLIMPLFLFCSGTSIPFSFTKRLARGESKGRLYGHVAWRFCILFVLGMTMDNLLAFDFANLHFFSDTLQAIGCGYVIAAVLLLNLRPAGQVLVTATLILLYWALMTFIPAPGHAGEPLGPQSNLAIYLDKLLLGRHHDGTYYTWILTSMVFGSTVTMGSLAGQWLRSVRLPRNKVLGLAGAGAALVLAGLGWSLWSPIIKYIWSSSFVLFSGGFCLLLLAGFYLVIDVWQWRRWTLPFVVVGMNAIVAYVSVKFIPFRDISATLVGGLAQRCGPWYEPVQMSVAFGLFWLMLFWMYRTKTFVKV